MKVQKITNTNNNFSFGKKTDYAERKQTSYAKDAAALLTAALTVLAASSQAQVIDIRKQVYEDYMKRKAADTRLLENFDFDQDGEISTDERLLFEEYKRLKALGQNDEAQKILIRPESKSDDLTEYIKIASLVSWLNKKHYGRKMSQIEYQPLKEQYESALDKISGKELQTHVDENFGIYKGVYMFKPVIYKLAQERYNNLPKNYKPDEDVVKLAKNLFKTDKNTSTLKYASGSYFMHHSEISSMDKEKFADYMASTIAKNNIQVDGITYNIMLAIFCKNVDVENLKGFWAGLFIH